MSNWEEREDHRPHGGRFYRDDKRRITVALESPRYYDAKGNLSPSEVWIFYRDTHGFREGEFSTAKEAMDAADGS